MEKCPKCEQIIPHCYCSALPIEPIDTDIRIIVLQDPYELSPSKLKVSSVPILKHVLRNFASYIVSPKSQWREMEDIDYESSVVLYPSESSIPILNYLDLNPLPKTVIVLDGSWVTVQESLHRMPYIQPHRIKHVRLSPEQLENRVSLYHSLGLRKEPAKNFISTAEAVALTLYSCHQPYVTVTSIANAFKLFVGHQSRSISAVPGSEEFFETQEVLLPNHGLKEKKRLSKAQARERLRMKEKRKRKHR